MNLCMFLESIFSNISVDTITTVCNIILIALVVCVLIGGLIGLFRGVWNATFRLIFVGLLVILSYVLSGTIGDAVAEINLQSFIGNRMISINDISVEITSVKETLIKLLGAYGTSAGGSLEKTLNDPKTLAVITELALMITRLITFFLLALIIILVGDGLASILYHLIFKHIIPKKVRKKVKLRAVGFLSGALKSVLVLSMLVVPFSSIANSISKAVKNGDDHLEKLDNETYEQLMGFIGAYDDSLLAKVLFNWTRDSNGNTLDMKLANIVTSTNESTMVFTNELSSIVGIASTLIGSGSIEISGSSEYAVTINMPILLSGEIISTLISQITSSNFILQILPIAANFALSIDDVKQYIDENKIDLSSIDWANDLNELNDFYQELYSLDIINADVLNDPTKALDILFDVENENIHSKIKTAFKKLDNVNFANQLISSFMWTMANQTDEEGNMSPLATYLPLEWDNYKNLKWGNELSIVYDSVYRINKCADNAILEFVSDGLRTGVNENKQIKKENEEANDATKTLINKILDNASALAEIIVGKRDNKGDFVNVDSEGLTLEAFDGCLLDSQLISNSFNKSVKAIMEILANTLKENLGDLSFEKANGIINELSSRLNYKKEFGAMLDIVAAVVEKDSLKGLFNGGKIDLTNEETCEDLKDPISKLDNSKIITAIMPEILKALCNLNKETIEEYGLTVSSFNFEIESLSSELLNIVDIIPAINRINGVLTDESSSMRDRIENLETKDLTDILNCIYDSDFLNHKWDGKKQNFDIVVDKLFTEFGYEGNITDDVNELDWKIEIRNLGTFFDSFKEGGLTSLIVAEGEESADYLNPEILNPDAIDDIFNCIDNSKLLRTATGLIFDFYLKELMESNNIDFISFKNITDWSAEGNNFANVIKYMQELNEKNGGLETIDILNSDARDEEGNLLTKNIALALVKSQLIKSYKYFGDYILDTLKSIDGIKVSDINDNAELSFEKVEQIFDEISTNSENKADSNTWESEIEILFDFIKALQNIGSNLEDAEEGLYGTAGFNALIDNPNEYKYLFVADGTDLEANDKTGIDGFVGINSSEILRMPIANIINDSIGSVDISLLKDLKLKERLNINALVEMDETSERNDEMNVVLDLLTNVIDLSDLSDFDEISKDESKIESLKNVLTDLHNSKILNTIKESNEDDTTVFEGFMISIFDASGVVDDAFIGKLEENQDLKYSDVPSLVKGIKNNRCDSNKEDEWIATKNEDGETIDDGEIYNCIDVVLACMDVTITDLNNEDAWENIDAYSILESLNKSKLLYRTIPYFMNDMLSKNDSLGINFKAAKIDYTFDEQVKDYSPFDDEELVKFATILENLSTVNNLSKDSFALSDFRGEKGQAQKESLKEILVALSESKVFHLEGSKIENEDTVFIQLMEELFVRSKLADEIYDEELFGYSNGAKANINNKLLQHDDLVKNSDIEWKDEIGKLINIFDAFIEEESIGDIESVDLSTIKPELVINVFRKINESDLCYDAVPKYMKEIYNSIHMSDFSEGYEVYLMEDYRATYEEEEIDNFEQFLNGIFVDGTYVSFNNEFSVTNLVKSKEEGGKGLSLTPIIRYISESHILKDCKGLVLMNAIESVGFADNIRNDYKDDEKTNVFTYILDKVSEIGEEQVVREGESLDQIVISLENLISSNKTAQDSFAEINSKAIKDIIDNCYDQNDESIKSLIASEIVAGFLSNAIKDSAYLDDDYYEGSKVKDLWLESWYKENGEDFKYPLFNSLESNSVKALIDAIGFMKDITFSNGVLNANIDGIKGCLSKTYDDEGNNSQIAVYLYEKAIYKLITDNFATFIYETKALSFKNVEAQTKFDGHYESLSNDAQSLDFSFKNNVEVNINGMFDAIEMAQ